MLMGKVPGDLRRGVNAASGFALHSNARSP
ncbi:hypothetical protein ACVMIH_001067 [Bradyrhizobium sp. USDA 4503]